MQSFFKQAELVNTQTIPMGNAQRISIEYIAERVTVLETEGTDIILKEYYNQNEPDYFAEITSENDEITIRHGERPILFTVLRGYVEVYLPKSYYGVLNIKTVSGRIEAPGTLTISELVMLSTSGRITVGAIKAGTAVLTTISGTIEVGSLRAMADVRSTSGMIRVGTAAGAGSYKTISGSIDARYIEVTGDLKASSTSGRVRLAVPPLLSFALEAHSVSGRIEVPLPGALLTGGAHAVKGNIGDNPQIAVKVKTVSSRIEIAPVKG